MTALEIVLSLVSSEACDAELFCDVAGEITEQKLDQMYVIAKKHDIAHIVGSALKKIEISFASPFLKSFYDEHAIAVFRYRRLADELSQISALFENEKILHIALKGALLRKYYPEPWMRTSCDIDVLVKKSDLDFACELLVSKLGYKLCGKTGHDVSFDSPTGVHLELHFNLIDDAFFPEISSMLEAVWDKTVMVEGKKYTLLMTDEMFYFYHIAHMAKHFLTGGCGIRTFLDLWMLTHRLPDNSEKRAALISEGGFADFEAKALELISVWFGKSEHSAFSRSFERFVLIGGAFGTVENSVSIGVANRNGKFRYIIRRIFPSLAVMKTMYPSLKKRKWLLPLCHVRRWFRIIFCGGAKSARAQFSKSAGMSNAEIEEVSRLISELGLRK